MEQGLIDRQRQRKRFGQLTHRIERQKHSTQTQFTSAKKSSKMDFVIKLFAWRASNVTRAKISIVGAFFDQMV